MAYLTCDQGAIMAVGASKPTVVADSDGFFSVKNKMLVSIVSLSKKYLSFLQFQSSKQSFNEKTA